MPAYRSSAEAEVRDAVVARIREIRPEARVMHEVNCSLFGPNRIDVIAVSPAEIISVEVKSAKDKLDRLPAQIASMKTMSHHVIAALHEKFLVESAHPTNEYCAHYERDGQYWLKEPPKEAAGAKVWVFPERVRTIQGSGYDRLAKWDHPDRPVMRANTGCIEMLWADEMRLFCQLNGIHTTSKSTREGLLPLVKWRCTGEQITKGVCAILRQRICPEADAPIAIQVAA